ncbi:UNVERIFIED_CONTAM: hypothetical protein Slati_0899800 [Sesamum latifolium]|uniref:Uncharacterized protein n=1 Tax=Sesamum latifolium TaxID=2727402 RepID=A0AAW2XTH5_9LAMI
MSHFHACYQGLVLYFIIGRSSPCGEVMTMPAPLPWIVEEPPTCNNQLSSLETSSKGAPVISETKSARAWALMVVRGKYEMSYSFISTAHFIKRPEFKRHSYVTERACSRYEANSFSIFSTAREDYKFSLCNSSSTAREDYKFPLCNSSSTAREDYKFPLCKSSSTAREDYKFSLCNSSSATREDYKFPLYNYSKAFKAKIESFVKDTIKLALTNFGTPGGTALPFISSLHQDSSIQMDTQVKAVKLVNSKLTISKSSSSSTKSVGVTTRSMSKKIKDSSQMTPLTEYVQKDFGSPNHASEDDGNKSPPSSPRSMSSHSFTTNVAPVMVTDATTIEEQLASLTRAIEGLTKHVQEQDAQIARLIHKADNVDASHIMGKQVEAHDEAEVSIKQRYTENDKSAKELQVSSNGMIPIDQLKEFIEGTIRSKIEGSSKSSLTYSKPYTPRIESFEDANGLSTTKVPTI